MKLFVLMHSIALLVNYHLSYNLTQFAICKEEGKQEQRFLLQRCQVVGWLDRDETCITIWFK